MEDRLREDASEAQAKAFYRKLVLKLHPDKDKRAMGTEESTRRTQVVIEARGILRAAIVAEA